MKNGDPDRVQEIFAEAMQLSPDRRAAFLDQVCGGQPDQRSSVERLLQALDGAGRDGFLAHPTSPDQDARAVDDSSERWPVQNGRIGPYRLLERVGVGGFGEVWAAEQTRPIRRTVALKILKPGMDSKEVLARFDVERQALALMDHPNVAQVHDAGATEQGRPYFVMEHAAGLPLTDYCDTSRLRVRERLELFVPICEAVQHAHTKGIIHRDLKPSNILVTLANGSPVPKVIDFGIAKATVVPLTDQTLHTELGRIMGTLEYMSPEQAGTGGIDVDTRTDVYSLGVILYQLLTGTLPFEPHALRMADRSALVNVIREVDPPTPSNRLSTLGAESVNQQGGATPQEIAGQRHTDFAALRRQVRGELDWIVMKCLEKDRTRRYETAHELGADVQRYLGGEPVVAAPPSKVYRLRKFVRRNRVTVTAAAAVVLSLLGGVAGLSYGLLRAEERRIEAEDARDLATEREEETGRVVEFQRAMIRGLDAGRMGLRIKDRLREVVKAELEREWLGVFPDRRPPTPEEVAAGLAEYDRLVGAAPAADLTRIVMDELVLSPATAALDEDLADQPRVRATLHLAIGASYVDLEMFDEAEVHIREAHEFWQQEFREGDWQLDLGLHNLGLVLSAKGDHAGAEPLLEEALELRRARLGDEHEEVTFTLGELAALRLRQGHPDARQLILEALELSRKVNGPESGHVANLLNMLGGCLVREGDLVGAESRFLEALEIDRDPALLHSLANIYLARKEYAAAQELYVEALERSVEIHGPVSLPVAYTKEGLALALEELGDPVRAKELLRESLELRRRLLGDDHPQVAQALENLGWVQRRMGDYNEAERSLREALELAEAGSHPALRAKILHQLATCLRGLGRAEEALPLAEEAVSICREHPDADRQEHAQATEVLACVLLQSSRDLYARGDLEEAENAARRAIEICRTHWHSSSTQHDHHAGAVVVLRQALVDSGNLDQAILVQREFVEDLRRKSPADDLHVTLALRRLGRMLCDQGDHEEAETILLECLEIQERILDPDAADYWELVTTWSALGGALEGQGAALIESDVATAVQLFEEAEHLLLDAGAWLTENTSRIPRKARDQVFGFSLQNLVGLYEHWDRVEPDGDKAEQAAKWRTELQRVR